MIKLKRAIKDIFTDINDDFDGPKFAGYVILFAGVYWMYKGHDPTMIFGTSVALIGSSKFADKRINNKPPSTGE